MADQSSDLSITPQVAPQAGAEGGPAADHPLDNAQEDPKGDSQFLQSIVTTETAKSEANILEAPPELDESLMTDIAPPKSILLLILKTVFGLVFAAGVVSVIFFTSQLTGAFDFVTSYFGLQTVETKVSALNKEIIDLQTNINLYNYLQIKAHLDEFSFHGDSYLKNYEVATSLTSSSKEKNYASSQLVALRPQIKESFTAISNLFAYPFTTTLIDLESSSDDTKQLFEQSLREKLTQKSEDLSEQKDYNQTLKLVGNTNLKETIKKTDFDVLTDEELYNLIRNVNSLIVNDLSLIQKIKDQRIKWSDIMNQIELRTIAVDPRYNDEYYKELGGIRYTSYDFDSENRRISITGETKLFTTTNFSMISNLIDEFNRSELFENAEMRSFSKSGSLEDGYSASLHLTLDLQEGVTSAINVTELPSFATENNVTR